VRLPVPVRRLGLRLAYAGLRVYWFLLRPRVDGVKCVLTDGERVLLVRHSYGPRGWDLPGGTVKRGEAPIATARREMVEELGISIEDWQDLGTIAAKLDHRRDRLHCFHAELHSPQLELDEGELLTADWFPRRELPRDLRRYVRPVLDQLPQGGRDRP
jgi:8-oxo-dGTP diphosphatase